MNTQSSPCYEYGVIKHGFGKLTLLIARTLGWLGSRSYEAAWLNRAGQGQEGAAGLLRAGHTCDGQAS